MSRELQERADRITKELEDSLATIAAEINRLQRAPQSARRPHMQ